MAIISSIDTLYNDIISPILPEFPLFTQSRRYAQRWPLKLFIIYLKYWSEKIYDRLALFIYQ